jgi:hypothetical protein
VDGRERLRVGRPRTAMGRCAERPVTTYKKLHGDMRVPKAFEVPPSAPWGEELRGMELGIAVSCERHPITGTPHARGQAGAAAVAGRERLRVGRL